MKRERGYESDIDEDKPAARKPRSNGNSDASHVIEDDNGGEGTKNGNDKNS